MASLGDFQARAVDGSDVDLSAYDGQVVLVVNTASKCGFAGQFGGLQRAPRRRTPTAASPCSASRPTSSSRSRSRTRTWATSAQRDFGVTFPMFAKVAVNGAEADPLFQWLRSEQTGLLGDRIKWNFTKFLVDRDGNVLGRYAPTTDPVEDRGRHRGRAGGLVPVRRLEPSRPNSARRSSGTRSTYSRVSLMYFAMNGHFGSTARPGVAGGVEDVLREQLADALALVGVAHLGVDQRDLRRRRGGRSAKPASSPSTWTS